MDVFVECLKKKKNPATPTTSFTVNLEPALYATFININHYSTKFEPAVSIGLGQFKVVRKQCAF